MFGLFKKKKVEVYAPCSGKMLDITEIDDVAFNQKMIGDGVAIEPEEGVIYSPFDGKVIQFFRTKHAIAIEKDNVQLLIHIGMDTVELDGEGFKAFVNEGDEVKKGQKLIEFDMDFIKSKGKSLITPIVVANMADIEVIEKGKTHERVIEKESVIFEVK